LPYLVLPGSVCNHVTDRWFFKVSVCFWVVSQMVCRCAIG